MRALLELPLSVQSRVLEYLALFRPEGSDRGLAWKKALKLVEGLVSMIKTNRVQWEGGEDRPAPPALWGAAIDAVVERRPRALKNHNYLRHVAWSMALPGAAQAEADRERALQNRPRPAGGEPTPVAAAYTEEQRVKGLEAIRRLKNRAGEKENPDER